MNKREYWKERFSVIDPLERVIAYMDYCYGSGQPYLDEEFMAGEHGSSTAYKLVDYIARYLRLFHPQSSASKANNNEE